MSNLMRFALILATHLFEFYVMLCLFLGKRRSGEIAGSYLFFKAVIVNVTLEKIRYLLIYVFTVGIAAILNGIVFCYVFDGGILKIILSVP